MNAQGLVHFYNISHCMFCNKLNDRRVVPLTHACNALHESMRTYTLKKKLKIANIILKIAYLEKNLWATNYRNDINTVYAMNKQFCAEKLNL
jgi:hypothetical protein